MSRNNNAPLKTSIEEIGTRKAYLVRWYCTDKAEREDFETYSKKFLNSMKWENAEKLIYEEDVAFGIKYWMELLHTSRMKNIYDKMYEQALKGDVQSAKFLMDFSKDFFKKNEENELNKLLKGIEVDEDD